MKIKILLSFVILTQLHASAQSIYYSAIKNKSLYSYKGVNGMKTQNLQAGLGNAFEVGYSTFSRRNASLISYKGGLTYNEYNTVVGTSAYLIKWQTAYLGVQNAVLYSLPCSKNFTLDPKIGLNLGKIIFGQQETNGIVTDIKNTSDFRGVLAQSVLGIEAKYMFSDSIYLGLGYDYVTSYDFNSSHYFYIVTHQIYTSIYFKLN